MSHLRSASALLLSVLLIATPAMAQQGIAQSAAATAAAAAQTSPQAPARTSRTPMFWTGVTLGIAGGAAIIAGSTFAKTADATSGNTPEGVYDACVALKSNRIYAGNDCDVLKGPNKAMVIGGALAAGAGVALAMIGAPHSSIAFGPGAVSFRQRIRF